MPLHDWAHTIVPRHVCAKTHLCPVTLVPQHELWLDTIMFLNSNNIIIIVPTRLSVNVTDENTSMPIFCRRSEMKCDY